MEELITPELTPKLSVTFKEPKNTSTVCLPSIRVNDKIIRSSMHTDKILSLLLYFTGNLYPSDRERLFIEGRAVTRKQWDRLYDNDKVISFFINSRETRTDQNRREDVVKFIIPKNSDLSDDEILHLSQLPFSPATYAKDGGYRDAYFNVEQICQSYQNGTDPNHFLPMLGGINEFKIGSDSLPLIMVRRIALKLQHQLAIDAANVENPTHEVVVKGQDRVSDIRLIKIIKDQIPET